MKHQFTMTGTCSTFGGPHDTGVSLREGLALYEYKDAINSPLTHLFIQPLDPKWGLARQLNPWALYCAMRWNYSIISRDVLRRAEVRVKALSDAMVVCRAVDWGPNANTGRIIDLSPGAAKDLGVSTDDVVTVELWIP